MTEALISTPASFIEAASNFSFPRQDPLEIPPHLIHVTGGHLGNEKGTFIEGRVQTILSAQLEVKEIIRNKANSEQDGKTHDLTVIFVEELGIEPIHIQVKSNDLKIKDYIQRIRRKLRRRKSNLTSDEWLIMDRTIVINGTEPKNDILTNFATKVIEILDKGPELKATRRYYSLFRKAA